MFCIIKIKSETNSHHSEESMSAQNRKSCNTAIRSVCHTPEPLRRRNGLRCAALFLRLRTVRAPACGRARAGSDSGRGVPTRRAAFGSRAARAAGVPPAGGFYSLCRGCTSYSHYSILRTAHRPLSYSAIKQWPVGCGFILSLWPAFVNP